MLTTKLKIRGAQNVKKIINLGLVVVLVLALLAGCAGNQPVDQPAATEPEIEEKTQTEEPKEEAKYKDGIYFAQGDEFSPKSGWKSVVTLEVKDGKIAKVDWTGAHISAGADKKTASIEGNYPMVERGGAQSHWHEQAMATEAYLIETQDPKAIEYSDNEGRTDAISGVSIHVNDFYALVEKALENGPVGKGKYKDGAYSAEEPEFSAKSGWKSTVDLTVINGNIVSVYWSGDHKDGGLDKRTASIEGNYPMVEKGGAQSHWHEQAAAAEAFLLEKQDPTAIEYSDDEGNTDAISGVSITVSSLFKLAEEALSGK